MIKDKIKIFYSKEDEGYIVSYKLLSGFGKTELSALKELAIAMSGALEVVIENSKQAIKERNTLKESIDSTTKFLNILQAQYNKEFEKNNKLQIQLKTQKTLLERIKKFFISKKEE